MNCKMQWIKEFAKWINVNNVPYRYYTDSRLADCNENHYMIHIAIHILQLDMSWYQNVVAIDTAPNVCVNRSVSLKQFQSSNLRPWHTKHELAVTKADCVVASCSHILAKSCAWTNCDDYSQWPTSRYILCLHERKQLSITATGFNSLYLWFKKRNLGLHTHKP